MMLQSACVRLRRCDVEAAEEAAATREVAQGVDVGADMRAERDRVGRGAVAGRADVFAVLLDEAVEERGMRRMVRHPDEIGLGEVIDLRGGESVEQWSHADGVRSAAGAATKR
jgi:hypothetical protein